MQNDKKLDLNYHGLILVTLNSEINLIPLILGNQNYSYHYPSRDYNFECCYLGFLLSNNVYNSFVSYQNNYLKDNLFNLENEYLKAKSLSYFNSINHLAKEFAIIKKEYGELSKNNKKIDYDKDPAKAYFNFPYIHPEIISTFDIRFSSLGYNLDYGKPIDNIMGVLKTFESNPDIDYQAYCDFLDEFYKYKKIQIRQEKTSEINDVLLDFNSLYSDLEKLLLSYDEVGVVYLSSAMPRRMLNKNIGILSDFNIEVYVHLKDNIIYWIRKNKNEK